MRSQIFEKYQNPQILAQALSAPALVGNAIRLGYGTTLAGIASNGSLWEPTLSDDEALAALLTAAYGRKIAAADAPVRAIKFAVHRLLKGDRAGAADALNAIRLGDVDEAGADRVAKAEALIASGLSPQSTLAQLLPALAKYSLDQPRVAAGSSDGGQWTTGDTPNDSIKGEESTGDIPAAVSVSSKTLEASEADKEKFTDDHLAAAQYWADKLHVPVENILGLSAFESGWGKGPFVVDGRNNFFSLYYPSPYGTGSRQNESGTVTLSTFASYDENLKSFAEQYGHLVQGISDPTEFATALQRAKRFGIIPSNGLNDPSFVPGVVKTINGFRSRVARRKV